MGRLDVTSKILAVSMLFPAMLSGACAGGAREPASAAAPETSAEPTPDPDAPPRGEMHGGSLAPST